MIKYILADFWKHYRQLDIFRQTKTISRVDIIKTKSVTNAFFSCPPVFLLHFSFSFSFARVIFELIRCKKKTLLCDPFFAQMAQHFAGFGFKESATILAKNPWNTQPMHFPFLLQCWDMITKLRGLQQHCEKEDVKVGGGGGERGRATFSKVFQGFCLGFYMLNAVNFYFFIVFWHGSVC